MFMPVCTMGSEMNSTAWLQGFCSNHKGYRRRIDEDGTGPRGAYCLSPGEDACEEMHAHEPDPRGDVIEIKRKPTAAKQLRRPARRRAGDWGASN